jgi:hypothetical protein
LGKYPIEPPAGHDRHDTHYTSEEDSVRCTLNRVDPVATGRFKSRPGSPSRDDPWNEEQRTYAESEREKGDNGDWNQKEERGHWKQPRQRAERSWDAEFRKQRSISRHEARRADGERNVRD